MVSSRIYALQDHPWMVFELVLTVPDHPRMVPDRIHALRNHPWMVFDRINAVPEHVFTPPTIKTSPPTSI